jgi:ADP-heptose:LPS heptosyltransferase
LEKGAQVFAAANDAAPECEGGTALATAAALDSTDAIDAALSEQTEPGPSLPRSEGFAGAALNRAEPKRVLLRNFQCPGDIVMLTAAVRDLYRASRGEIEIAVDTSCRDIWDFNPYIRPYQAGANYQIIDCEYPLIHQSNVAPYHFIHGFAQQLEGLLGLRIPLTEFKGDIHISEIERSWMSQIAEMGIYDDFWIVLAGGKYDYTSKWWNPASFQAVVDHFEGRIQFVQCGEKAHWHPPLRGVINLVGKTDLRQFIRLVYHSVGVLCPVTFGMHAAVAVPVPIGRPPLRACVVISGGREPTHWEAYPSHRFLSNVGSLPCCSHGGCWRSRCQKVHDGDSKDNDNLCEAPVALDGNLSIARCMDMIRPADVIRAIESYYEGGVLRYGRGEVSPKP